MTMKTIVACRARASAPRSWTPRASSCMGTGLQLKILTPPQDNPLPEETKRAAREADGVL